MPSVRSGLIVCIQGNLDTMPGRLFELLSNILLAGRAEAGWRWRVGGGGLADGGGGWRRRVAAAAGSHRIQRFHRLRRMDRVIDIASIRGI